MQPSVKCEKRAPCLTAYAIAPLRRVLIGRVAPNRRSAHEARPESGRPLRCNTRRDPCHVAFFQATSIKQASLFRWLLGYSVALV